jgi:replication-associated recombination protein RarA
VIVGHDRVMTELLCCSEPAMLLQGPSSVGKFTTARHVAYSWEVQPADLFCIEKLSANDAKQVADQLAYIPPFGDLKVFIIRTDGATPIAQNILLKTLEEPTPGVRFFLVASEPVLPTVASRCRLFQFGLLSDAEVERVLSLTGMNAESAAFHAPLGAGRVRAAREGVSPHARGQVVSALRALAARDASMLPAALREWDDAAHSLLKQWAAEAASGRWRVFTEETVPGLGPAAARRLLGRLGSYSQSAPKLAAYAALDSLCWS